MSASFRSVKAARQVLGSVGRKLSRQFREVAQLALDSSGSTSSQPDVKLDQTGRPTVSFGPHDTRSVLLCISNLQPSHHKTIVRFVNTVNIEDDKNLFSAFRNEYKKSVGRLRWWFSMRTIVGIRFVHVSKIPPNVTHTLVTFHSKVRGRPSSTGRHQTLLPRRQVRTPRHPSRITQRLPLRPKTSRTHSPFGPQYTPRVLAPT